MSVVPKVAQQRHAYADPSYEHSYHLKDDGDELAAELLVRMIDVEARLVDIGTHLLDVRDHLLDPQFMFAEFLVGVQCHVIPAVRSSDSRSV